MNEWRVSVFMVGMAVVGGKVLVIARSRYTRPPSVQALSIPTFPPIQLRVFQLAKSIQGLAVVEDFMRLRPWTL